MEFQDAHIGDVVLIMITGMTGKYEARIIEMDDKGYPILEAEPSGPFSRLKRGDYILMKRRSAI
jgi:hypothetical protein